MWLHLFFSVTDILLYSEQLFLWLQKNIGKELGIINYVNKSIRDNKVQISHWLETKCPIWQGQEVMHEKHVLDFHYLYFKWLSYNGAPPFPTTMQPLLWTHLVVYYHLSMEMCLSKVVFGIEMLYSAQWHA